MQYHLKGRGGRGHSQAQPFSRRFAFCLRKPQQWQMKRLTDCDAKSFNVHFISSSNVDILCHLCPGASGRKMRQRKTFGRHQPPIKEPTTQVEVPQLRDEILENGLMAQHI